MNQHENASPVSGKKPTLQPSWFPQRWLSSKQIKNVYLAGLATDFCVAYSALDAVRLGFDATVILSACRAIDLEGSLDRQLTNMQHAGVTLLEKIL